MVWFDRAHIKATTIRVNLSQSLTKTLIEDIDIWMKRYD